ncbi:hypothetical protein M426DRAFT_158800 [Hypoxylon sp. CI-4A]|nr:hypothetical protein M426DRAFT_158800 [Hypoxylon sp. CI-4A]
MSPNPLGNNNMFRIIRVVHDTKFILGSYVYDSNQLKKRNPFKTPRLKYMLAVLYCVVLLSHLTEESDDIFQRKKRDKKDARKKPCARIRLACLIVCLLVCLLRFVYVSRAAFLLPKS